MEQDNREEKEQLPYYYWLHSISGIGNITIRKLLEEFQTPKTIFEADKREIQKVISPSRYQKILAAKSQEDIKGMYQNLVDRKIKIYPKGYQGYPKRLLEIPDPPEVLYGVGELPIENIPAVAMIGARNCSEYGKYVAVAFGKALAATGIQVVSGMAKGIDGISQRAVLQEGGKSFAVLGSGVDVCYPMENKDIYKILQTEGGILSEYVPGTSPQGGNFPPRNRIISGLSDIVLVIEAKEKSGTLITVDMALEQGKEVFVVPGRVTDSFSFGCNKLIKQGAGIVLSTEDLIEEILQHKLQVGNYKGENVTSLQENQPFLFLSQEEKLVYEQVDFYPKTVDQIYLEIWVKKPMVYSDFFEIILNLCMKKKIAQISDGQFVKIT